MNFRMFRGLIWKKWSPDGQHGAVVAMYQFSLPGKTTAFLHPPGWGKRVFPHWNDWKTFQQALSLPRSRPRVHRGFYIGNQPARATWVLETLVSKQNWVLQFLSQKFNEARSWSRELGGSQPSHNIPHSLRRHGNHEMKDATNNSLRLFHITQKPAIRKSSDI